MNLKAFVGENPPDFMRGVGILSGHHLGPGLDDRHFAAETTIGLRQFKAGIAAADHDQMRRQDVELERFDMGDRLGGLEARNVRNGRVRSHIQEDLRADKRACPAVIQAHFERFRRDEAPAPYDQFGAACPCNCANARRLALGPCRACAGRTFAMSTLTGPVIVPNCAAVARQMRDLGAANFVLARQARDIGAGSADPPAFDDRGPPPRARHMPSVSLPAASAAKNENVDVFGLRHEHPP